MNRTLVLILTVFLAGCSQEPSCPTGQSMVGDSCCIDKNENNICDTGENLEKIVLVVEDADPTCDDEIQNQDETGIDCGGACPPCPETTTTIKKTAQTPGYYEEPPGYTDPGERDFGRPWEKPKTDNPTIPQHDNNEIPFIPVVQDPFDPDNLTTCKIRNMRMTATGQDASIGDTSVMQDAHSIRVNSRGYLMVGDLPPAKPWGLDHEYRIIISIPLAAVPDRITDAHLHVLPYLTQGTSRDTHIQQIPCMGEARMRDYSIPPLKDLGVIVPENGSNYVDYSIPVTPIIQRLKDNGERNACFRLYWKKPDVIGLRDNQTDRRIFYGYGTEGAPYISYVARPCIECETNNDCGNTSFVTDYLCRDGEISKQFVHYRCERPGTENATCTATQEVEVHRKCGKDESCIPGESECFPDNCYNGEEDSDEHGEDCGGRCRPCECFNGLKDPEEEATDCGGICRPCEKDERMTVVTIISPRNGMTYNKTRILTRYTSNKKDVSCMYSINGKLNGTLAGTTELQYLKGNNTFTLECRDVHGKTGIETSSFTVDAGFSDVCVHDNLWFKYGKNFEKVTFITDGVKQIGGYFECRITAFTNATSLGKNSTSHSNTVEKTFSMSDELFYGYDNSRIGYRCDVNDEHAITYIHPRMTVSAKNISALRTILYFREADRSPGETAYFRIFRYNPETDRVDTANYIDIPYEPRESLCSVLDPIHYQELDVSGLLQDHKPAIGDELELRIALYDRRNTGGIEIAEMEYSEQ